MKKQKQKAVDLEDLKAENLRLNSELEQKTKELEIEAAMERVRARALGMHNSDELNEVVAVLYEQLHAFGLAAWGCSIMIFNEEANRIENWVAESTYSDLNCYYVKGQKHPIYKKLWQNWKKQGPTFTLHHEDEVKREFDEYWLYETGFNALPDAVKSTVLNEREIFLTYATMRHGFLSAAGYQRLPDEKVTILERFAKVFEQTYTRFLDLQKAEAQAREAQIEAALERVRSRSLAMHKTAELQSVIHTVHQELLNLNISISGGSFIVINNEIDTELQCWGSGGTADTSDEVHIPRFEKPFYTNLLNGIKNGPGFFTEEYTREEKIEFFTFLFKHEPWSTLDSKQKEVTLSAPGGYTRSCTVSIHTSIFIINHSGEKFSAAENDILQRFGKVFEQTYTRFLDLQKAEAQAREARIEAALERVRSSAMAMHASEDLYKVAEELRKQIGQLDYKDLETCAIHLYDESPEYFVSWAALLSPDSKSDIVHSQVHFPKSGVEIFDEMMEAYNTGKKDYVIVNEGKKMVGFLKMLKQYAPGAHQVVTNTFKDFKLKDFRSFWTISDFAGGSLLMSTLTRPDVATHNLLSRFANVFGLAYRRFTDLKRAEAQAREAQIELALERVRARTMAMQSSDELRETVLVINEQLQQLGFEPKACNIIIIDKDTGDSQYWVTGFSKDIYPVSYHVPYLDHPYYEALLQPWRQGKKYMVYEYTEEMKRGFDEIFFVKTEFRNMPDEVKKLMIGLKSLKLSTAYFSYGALQVLGPEALSEEKVIILQRFAQVFDQTYTRFLDLQKAEAQAREAQIEAALERVRSRTMAMHNSDELGEVAIHLYKEFNLLIIGDFFICGFVIVNEAERIQNGWLTQPEGTFIEEMNLPYPGDVVLKKRAKAWKERTPVFCDKVSGEKLEIHIKYVRDHSKSANQVNTQLPYMPDPCYFYCGNFAQGYLHILAKEQLRPEDEVVLSRFTKVFEQTYTRFLDLQKAEAQAREAQIEVSLERVRSRAMAMHNSEELGEAAEVLYKELQKLGITDFINCGYVEVNEQNQTQFGWITNTEGKAMERFYLPLVGESVLDDRYEAWMRKDPIFCQTVAGEMLKEHLRFVSPQLGSEEALQNAVNNFPDPTIFYCGNFSHGYLCIITGTPLTSEKEALLARFTRVFEMTYKRFLDLQKAEAQAREAEIELALERVRARTMAMQKSDELRQVVATIFDQLQSLGFDSSASLLAIYNDDLSAEQWMAGFSHEELPKSYHVPYCDHPYYIEEIAGWQEGLPFKELIFEGDDKIEYARLMLEISDYKILPEEFKQEMLSPKRLYISNAHMRYGLMEVWGDEPLDLKSIDILGRFAKVFEQTYTRFLDLQKAEAQAREVKIELALEKVRARTMAMHQSSELAEAGNMVFQQIKHLGIHAETSWFWFINLKSDTIEIWTTHENKIAQSVRVKASDYITFKRELDAWKNQEPFVKLKIPKQDAKNVLHDIFGIELNSNKEATHFHLLQIYHKNGFLGIGTWSEATEEEMKICTRFAKVFDQTYIRFLDLQKAEEQAREAQVEASLERVRARMMAMHKTDELHEVLGTIFTQLQSLGVYAPGSALIIYNHDLSAEHWMTGFSGDYPESYKIPYVDHPYFTDLLKAWKDGVPFAKFYFEGDLKIEYARWCLEHSDFKRMPPEFKKEMLNPDRMVISDAFNKYGMIEVLGPEPLSKEASDVLTRFSKVFEQTYTRFLDLQKAEAQAREAQIEAALERVRSRTIGMQRSDELQETAALMFQQIESLGVNIMGCGFNIWDDDRKEATAWMSGMDRIQPPFKTSSSRDIFLRIYEAAQKGESFFTEEQAGEELIEHYKYMASIPVFKKILDHLAEKGLSAPSFQIMHCAFFSQGYLMFITHEPASNAYDIFKRFAKVFEQTYTRFLDLKKAEAQAREAIKQASLDRVRGEIASMRTKEDLDRITPLIWKELIALGVPFIRCGVFIMDEEKRVVHTYLSTPDGKSLSAFEMNFDSQEIAARAVEYWYKKQIYHDFWDKEKFVSFMQTLLNTGRIKTPESYQGSSAPPESLYLNFVPFKQGMLYVGNTAALGHEELALVMSLADSFSIAYARYEDFNKLEAAKQQVDKALVDLKQTQQQLVQSEKMASLGELTAGIAHEIQNPLNFVNNFSEINRELLDEIEEIRKRSPDASGGERDERAETEILQTLRQNLEKINFHGKRADGIVKSMLQHSRTSDQSGKNKKEPTDINVLADEYLRLAYHGLRAKDKSFNATLKTDFDPAIGLIEVIPQDIARAMLNLITNAFYAVHEKSRQRVSSNTPPVLEDYQPTVSITTKKTSDKTIEIHVQDNGPGIPQNVLDKIFQPFFTTKPTGQGTGLGLSLAYDIVKAHGGELRVETEVGVGSEFIIILPVV